MSISRRLGFGGLVVVAGLLAVWPSRPGPQLTLEPAGFERLEGWDRDALAAAVPAFLKSCEWFQAKPNAEPLDAKQQRPVFGHVGAWRPLCAAAAALPPGDDAAARRFFETGFRPLRAGNNGEPAG